MDPNQKAEYSENIEEYLEEYKVYDYFYELMKEVVTEKPKNLIDFLIERISKSETQRCVIMGPPGFSRLGLGRLISDKVGWKYFNMSEWIGKEVDLEKDPRPAKPVHERQKIEKPESQPKDKNTDKPDDNKDVKVEDTKVDDKKVENKKEEKDNKDDKKENKKEDNKDDKKDDKKDNEDDKKDDTKSEKDDTKYQQSENKEVDKKSDKDNKKDDTSVKDKKSEVAHSEHKSEKAPSEKVEEPKQKPELEVPQKTQQEELNDNLLKYRDEVIQDNPQEDIINKHLYEDIKYEMSSSLQMGFISDQKVIEIFKKYTKEYDHECWILEGFPKTRAQALSLSKNKQIPDKIFLIKYSDEVAIEHIKESLLSRYGEEAEDAVLDTAARKAMQEYHMNIKDVQDLFKNVIHIIDAHGYVKGYSDDQNKVSYFVEELSRLIQMKRMSPDRRLRIIVVGSPGSGRSSQASAIAKKYGLVHVSTSNLLKNEIRLKTERGRRIKECFNNSKLVPDEIICSLVEARIKQNDCKLNGWVIDGFPKTIQQITVLKAMKIKPTRVVILECDKKVCQERILNRMFDPVMGTVYKNSKEAPQTKEIQDRLTAYFPDMTEDKVSRR